MNRTELAIRLFTSLSIRGGLTKYDLKHSLCDQTDRDVTTSDINSVLYDYCNLFHRNEDTPPRWWTIGQLDRSDYPVECSTGVEYSDCYCGPPPRAWQNEAFSSWISLGCCGIVEAVTGTGKTTVGVLAAGHAIERGLDVLVVVPSLVLLDQWHDVLSKNLRGVTIGRYGGGQKDSFEHCHIIVGTVHSVCQQPPQLDEPGGLLIADEVHRFGTPEFSNALVKCYGQRLGLTATYERPDEGLEQWVTPYFLPTQNMGVTTDVVVGRCTYARGLDDNILAPFRVALVGIEFDGDSRDAYDDLEKDLATIRRQLIYAHGCSSEPFGDFMKDVAGLSKGGDNNHQGTWRARKFLNLFNQKRDMLAGCPEKVATFLEYAETVLEASRTLIFSETKRSAHEIAATSSKLGLVIEALTSDLPQTERRALLDRFRAGKSHALVAPKLLDEGVDIPEADVGIITSASMSRRQMIQRMGRIIRPKSDGRAAHFVIFYMKATSEDPHRGAHEAFIAEMLDVAEGVDYFDGSADTEIFGEWWAMRECFGANWEIS